MSTIATNQSRYSDRIKTLTMVMKSDQLDLVVFNPGPSMTYLTGLNFHLMERPVLAYFRDQGSPVLVLPELEASKLLQTSLEMQVFTYGEDPVSWKSVFLEAAAWLSMDKKRVGVEPTRLRLLEYQFLKDCAPEAEFRSSAESLGMLRSQKDPSEISAIRKAVRIAQDALEETLPAIQVGKTEQEIASILMLNLLQAGSDFELPFAPIVSSGPNSANPHASPTDRKLKAGDLLVIDWGASYQGYISDLTRTFAIGKVDPELSKIAKIVADANAAGRVAAKPETTAGWVDHSARQIIENSGYGVNFIHRTGHGIGLEPHEEPYIRKDNALILQPGMVFTIEPGIYLPGKGGVRIEDNIVITSSGAECLSELPRELRTLG